MKKVWCFLGILVCSFALLRPAQGSEEVLESFYQAVSSGEIEIVDLSHAFREGMPVFPGGIHFNLHPLHRLGKNAFYANWYEVGEHVGTHVDLPSHIIPNGKFADEMPLPEFVAPVSMIDVSDKAQRNSDYGLTLKDIETFEETYGTIPEGSVVVARTGWSGRWNDSQKYVNADKSGKPHFPGFLAVTAQWLINHRQVRALGIDTLSLDPGFSKDFPVHRLMLGRGKYMIENLTNLEKLPPRGALLVAFPVSIEKGSGAPSRVVAFVRKQSQEKAQ